MHAMIRLSAFVLCLPLLAMAAPVAPSALADSLDSIVASHHAPDMPGVAALVLQQGKPVLRKGYGMANLELGVRVTPEHVFRIGSTTKLFTATAIMLLVDEGKLALDAPIARYLPDAPAQWAKVTVEHLLTHTSGIPDASMDSGYYRIGARLDHTTDELVAPVRARPLDFEPGTKFVYNNTGYNLLGLLIEKVSSQEFFAFIDRRIVQPLGLRHTAAGNDKQVIPGLVTGYRAGPKPAWPIATGNFYAAGGLVSTVDDLAAFMLALQGGKIVSRAGVERMNAPYVLANGKQTEYGYGEWIRRVNGKRLVGHGGYIFSFYSQLEMDIDSGIVVVTLHNGDRFGGDNEKMSKQLIMEVQRQSRAL